MENLKSEVQTKFTEIRNALHMREKLLLRQADVILQQATQQPLGRGTAPESREVKFLTEQEEDLLKTIRNFGRFQLDNINLTLHDVYLKNEDYITPTNDHETMYKCLQQANLNSSKDENELECHNVDGIYQEQPEAIVVDFSRNKSLIEHNAKNMNESIINITLQEAKELIKKAKLKRDTPIPPLNLEELDDEFESSIAEAVSSLGHDASSSTATEYLTKTTSSPSAETKPTKTTKKPSSSRFKPKITINNCNGTINLRNISSLTINCATEDSISAQIPVNIPPEPTDELSQNNDNQSDNMASKNCTQSDSTIKSSQKSSTLVEANDSNSSSSNTGTNSNYSSNSSSRSQSKKQKSKKEKKSSSSQLQTKTTEEGQQTTNSSAAYPYGIVDYDDDSCDNLESHAITCDFYNRLLKEIKNSLRTKQRPSAIIDDDTHYVQGDNNEVASLAASSELQNMTPAGNCDPNSNSSYISSARPVSLTTRTATASNMSNINSQQQPGAGRRLVLKNFENLRIVLEANSSDEESFHPVQIEQWLAEIISETDLEPMQNTDILEHSKIHTNNENQKSEKQ